jgi:hypothetical protein
MGMTSPLDVFQYGTPPTQATEIPALTLPPTTPGTPYPRGLASVAATRYARQERGMEAAVRFAVRLADGSHYGEFVYSDEGWRWV